MPWFLLLIFLFAFFSGTQVQAIETSSGYNTNPPTSSDIPHWNTGWGNANVTGWNYAGQVNWSAGIGSGVYLGNGWVLTAAHIENGITSFILGGITYTAVPNSGQSISNGTVDLYMFQIASPPNLPLLVLSSSPPVAFASTQTPGSSVAMFGMGGSSSMSWGLDTVTEINEPISITANGTTYTTNDFFTDNSTVTRGIGKNKMSIVNNAMVVTGDSGGGDFIYNSTTQKRELAGLNEATGSWNGSNGDPYYGNGAFSAFIQLSTYASQINTIVQTPFSPPATDEPAMPLSGLVVLGCALFLVASRYLKVKSIEP